MCGSIKVGGGGRNCHYPHPTSASGPDPRACQASPSLASRRPPPVARSPMPGAAPHTHRSEAQGLWSLALRDRAPATATRPGCSGRRADCALQLGAQLRGGFQTPVHPRANAPGLPSAPRSSSFFHFSSSSQSLLSSPPLPLRGLMLGEGRGREKVPSV